MSGQGQDQPETGPSAGRQKPRLSPLPVRLMVWLLLVALAVAAIRVVDHHAMLLQERLNSGQSRPGDDGR